VSGSGGDYYWEIDNQDKRDAIWLVDLRLAFARGPLTLTAYARNLLDERYEMEFVPVEFSAAVSGDIGAPSIPRQLGLQARWDF
jgi:iron complex outermembrane receptor protein